MIELIQPEINLAVGKIVLLGSEVMLAISVCAMAVYMLVWRLKK